MGNFWWLVLLVFRRVSYFHRTVINSNSINEYSNMTQENLSWLRFETPTKTYKTWCLVYIFDPLSCPPFPARIITCLVEDPYIKLHLLLYKPSLLFLRFSFREKRNTPFPKTLRLNLFWIELPLKKSSKNCLYFHPVHGSKWQWLPGDATAIAGKSGLSADLIKAPVKTSVVSVAATGRCGEALEKTTTNRPQQQQQQQQQEQKRKEEMALLDYLGITDVRTRICFRMCFCFFLCELRWFCR